MSPKVKGRTDWDQVYAGKYQEHGPTYRALLWGDPERQFRSYARVCEQVALKDKAVVDVGCGFGDLLGFLDDRGQTPRSYIGIDRRQEFVVEARKRWYEGTTVLRDRCHMVFTERDVSAGAVPRGDVVLAIGLLATCHAPRDLLERLWEAADEALVVTGLSDLCYRGRLLAWDPQSILAMGLLLSHDVRFLHEPKDQEFVLTVRRSTPPLRGRPPKAPTSPQRAPERS